MITELMGKPLSDKQAEALSALWRGLSVKEMAQELNIAHRTAKRRLTKLVKIAQIDSRKYIPRVRLCYLVAVESGLIPRID